MMYCEKPNPRSRRPAARRRNSKLLPAHTYEPSLRSKLFEREVLLNGKRANDNCFNRGVHPKFPCPICVQNKQHATGKEPQRMGRDGKCSKILGGCNHIKGKDLSFCRDGDS